MWTIAVGSSWSCQPSLGWHDDDDSDHDRGGSDGDDDGDDDDGDDDDADLASARSVLYRVFFYTFTQSAKSAKRLG